MTKSDYAKCDCRHCAGHIEYPADAAGQTVTCPHCGQAVELPVAVRAAGKRPLKMVWGLMVIWVVIIAATIVMMAFKRSVMATAPGKPADQSAAPAQPPVVKAPEETTTTNGFAVSLLKLEKTPGSSLVYVTGTVRNVTDNERFGVKAEFSLVDSNGVSAGTASDYAQTIAAHDTWKFKALVMESRAAQATLEAVREDQ
jgi:hypothetical protein